MARPLLCLALVTAAVLGPDCSTSSILQSRSLADGHCQGNHRLTPRSRSDFELAVNMPDVRPRQADTYLCTAVPMPAKQLSYIVDFEPQAVPGVTHHMLLFGCELPASSKLYWNCGSRAGPCADEAKIVYSWAHDAPATRLPPGVGYMVGGHSQIGYLVLQVHYGSISAFTRGGRTGDCSGVNLHMTMDRQPLLAGMYMLMAPNVEIPPGLDGVNADVACSYGHKYPIYPFAYRVHTHSLGRMVSGYIIRKGKWIPLGEKDPQKPQAFYPIARPLEIIPGDTVAARCEFSGRGRNSPTFIGSTSHDEMCNFYVMYSVDADVGDPFMSCTMEAPAALSRSFPASLAAAGGRSAAAVATAVGGGGVGGPRRVGAPGYGTLSRPLAAVAGRPDVDSYQALAWSRNAIPGYQTANRPGVTRAHANVPWDSATALERKLAERLARRILIRRILEQLPAPRPRKREEEEEATSPEELSSLISRLLTDPQGPVFRHKYNPPTPALSSARDDDHDDDDDDDVHGGDEDPRTLHPQQQQGPRFFPPRDALPQDPTGQVPTGKEEEEEVEEFSEVPAGDGDGQRASGSGVEVRGVPAMAEEGGGGPAMPPPRREPTAAPGSDKEEEEVEVVEEEVGQERRGTDLEESLRMLEQAVDEAGSDARGVMLREAGGPGWPGDNLGLGSVSGVAVDSKNNLHLFHRGARVWDGSSFDERHAFRHGDRGPIREDTILTINPGTGELLGSAGRDTFFMPHGLSVDPDDNLWVTDVALHQVFKLGPGGRGPASMALGERWRPGGGARRLCQPTDVAVHPLSRHLYVSDGYCNHRVVHYSPRGDFLGEWDAEGGRTGSGLRVPHSLTMARGGAQVCASDRENGRVVCFHPESGRLLKELRLPEFGGRVFAASYSPAHGGVLFAVNGANEHHPTQGFILDFETGRQIGTFRPEQGFAEPHDVAVSPDGEGVYVGDVWLNRVWKFSARNGSTGSMAHGDAPAHTARLTLNAASPSRNPLGGGAGGAGAPQLASGKSGTVSTAAGAGEGGGGGAGTAAVGSAGASGGLRTPVLIAVLLTAPVVVLALAALLVRIRKHRAAPGEKEEHREAESSPGGFLGSLRGKKSGGKFDVGAWLARRRRPGGFDRLPSGDDDAADSEEVVAVAAAAAAPGAEPDTPSSAGGPHDEEVPAPAKHSP
ncbi:LOW QUALITY PROTEIN: peptidyl-glycine alpha-amidating monooxygenase [Lethenteron reissneri]|uniref:LOW QUALITY PROTEIN: peptidyl-glycine alpha-amidating monooxygenase n=1 Tax=Lethenteron reissneri TaxID=7753 RepID=UPI002AB77DEC|nr:LOW QUALITY PROTEIN: peptidyl-glycine alpha-amidating monooxygenase [Lethenteron reissneri]